MEHSDFCTKNSDFIAIHFERTIHRGNYDALMTVLYNLMGFLRNHYLNKSYSYLIVKVRMSNTVFWIQFEMLNRWNISGHNHTWLHTSSTLWHMYNICNACFHIVDKLFHKMLTVEFEIPTEPTAGRWYVSATPGQSDGYPDSQIFSFIGKWESENEFAGTSGHFRLIQIWLYKVAFTVNVSRYSQSQ